MRKLLTLLMVLGLGFGMMGSVGCQKDSGDHAEDAVDSAGKAIGEGADETGDAIKDATD